LKILDELSASRIFQKIFLKKEKKKMSDKKKVLEKYR